MMQLLHLQRLCLHRVQKNFFLITLDSGGLPGHYIYLLRGVTSAG